MLGKQKQVPQVTVPTTVTLGLHSFHQFFQANAETEPYITQNRHLPVV